MSNWVPTVNTVTDNIDTVSAGTINPVISSLTTRDQYLFERLDSYADKSILVAYTIPVDQTYNPPITTGDVVYYNFGGTNQVLKKAITGFNSEIDPSHLTPAPSAYVFGVVQQVTAGGFADVYVRGFIDLTQAFGGSWQTTLGNMLDTNAQDEMVARNYAGPLYLSSIEPGKLTFDPNGASVFVALSIGNGGLWIAPNIDSLNQLFFNYKVYLVPMLAAMGAPDDDPEDWLTQDGDAWQITGNNFNRTGWVDADAAVSNYPTIAAYKPDGAKFFYNVPLASYVNATADPKLSDLQIKDTLLLKDALPPYPAAFTMFFMNGVLQTAMDVDHTDGNYVLNNAGVWWMNDADDSRPWTMPTDTTPVTLTLQTTKLNPFYKSTVVSSLTSFKDNTNDTSKVLTVIDSETGVPGTYGDLLLKFNLPVLASTQLTPDNIFVKSISYDQLSGLDVTTGYGVVDIQGGPGLRVVNTNGRVILSLQNYSLEGTVEDIEPEEADFVYKGLHSFLRLKNPSNINQQIGFIGKFPLPGTLPTNIPLQISLLAFGDITSSNSANFIFEYVVSSPGAITTNKTSTNLQLSGFVANNASKLGTNSFVVPATALIPGGYLNFRIVRAYTPSAPYAGNINVLGVYWNVGTELSAGTSSNTVDLVSNSLVRVRNGMLQIYDQGYASQSGQTPWCGITTNNGILTTTPPIQT